MAPGPFASAWHDARRADVTLVLAPHTHAAKRARTDAATPLQEGVRLPAHTLVLDLASAYFRTLLDTELPTAAAKDGEGRRVLVVDLDSEEEVQAAEALLELMYLEEVPAACRSNPQQLARMCHLADRWQAPKCLRLCFSALAALAADVLTAEALTTALPLLPFGTSSLRELDAELDGFVTRVVETLADVHAVLTTPALLQLLLALPFEVMLAWTGSDGLVVDSENSVVVALDCWVREGRGRGVGKEELLQLSGLVRVQHLTPSYHLRLPELPWWHHGKDLTQSFSWAASLGVGNVTKLGAPAAWTAAPRKQLPDATLQQRCALSWDVPRADLEATLSKEGFSQLWSPTQVYAVGHGIQLGVEVEAKAPGQLEGAGTNRDIGVHTYGATFTLAGVPVLPTTVKPLALSSFETSALTVAGAKDLLCSSAARAFVLTGWGAPKAFAASAVADLEPHLAQGHLKLRVAVLPMRSCKG